MDNYLVLTADGLGSTYLQRALFCYLNAAGFKYDMVGYLSTGISLEDNRVRKSTIIGYQQDEDTMCNIITQGNNNIVAREAMYHINTKKIHFSKNKDWSQYYNVCNKKFNKIVVCERDPFEYALNWAIRDGNGYTNVFSISERAYAYPEGNKFEVQPYYFLYKLAEYDKFLYWANDNFRVDHKINYKDMQMNSESILQTITGLDYTFVTDFGITIDDYNKVTYNTSKYIQNPDEKYRVPKEKGYGVYKLQQFEKSLIEKGFTIDNIPVKMNTLEDKRNKVTNFEEVVSLYNDFAKTKNNYEVLTEEVINQRIAEENKFYRF